MKGVEHESMSKYDKEARKEMIKAALLNVNILETAVNILGLTPQQYANNRRYIKFVESSSLVLDLKSNRAFYNKYGSSALSPIDLIKEYSNLSLTQAVNQFLKYYSNRNPEEAEIFHYDPLKDQEVYVSRGLLLPEPNKDDVQAVNYLRETRRISDYVINYIRENGMFYEDTYHNCVFVGEDYEGQQKFGCKRGTIPNVKFHRDCIGSFKNCGFFIPNRFPVKKLVITECVIDALSYLSLNPSLIDAHVLGASGAGTAPNTLWYNYGTRECLKNINEIVTCFDCDEAGLHAHEKIVEWVKENNLPIKVFKFEFDGAVNMRKGYDLNDYLIERREQEDYIAMMKETVQDNENVNELE